MPRRSIREFGEAVAVVGVVASLVFVGLELRQSRIAAQAAAYQELGIAVAENWMGRANDRELNDLILMVNADSETWAALDSSEVYLVRSYTLANIRLYETAYLQVEQGLLDEEALNRLGWTNFLNGTFLERMWPYARSQVSPAFRSFLEAEQPRLGR